MAAETAHSNTWRENAPLFGVASVLLAALLALILWGAPPEAPKARTQPTEASYSAQPATAPKLDALPATAEDTVVLSELSPEEARARNSEIELAAVGPGKARPFAFRGSSSDRLRARDCLALAGMAEAGSGDSDQRAVMQVVLNRVRHPAFAKTVCGVVFEGAERPIGCQFSFTCDGSLARTYSDDQWRAARRRADEMLGGATDAAVGSSTHFHADYVYPWWSNRLDKVAQVGSHLFFRWRGFWGTASALSARYGGGEPDPLTLRQQAQAIAAAHPLPTLLQSGEAVRSIVAEQPTADESETTRTPHSPAPGVHFVLVSSSDSPEALLEKARAMCPGDRYCQVYGWDDAGSIPEKLPLSDASRRTLRFSFLPTRSGNNEVAYFDCRIFPSPSTGSCLPSARP